MPLIFISYRRTDGPQAHRVFDWLTQRFGLDEVFMDVSNIPSAVAFPEHIAAAIQRSHLVLALVGKQWMPSSRTSRKDWVRTELELALSSDVPILPLLIDDTSMPDEHTLPASLASIGHVSALTVGTRHFDSHMRVALPTIEGLLGSTSRRSIVAEEPLLIRNACSSLATYLQRRSTEDEALAGRSGAWEVVGAVAQSSWTPMSGNLRGDLRGATIYLHRIVRLAELLELHLLLSFYGPAWDWEQTYAGWVLNEFERTPILPLSDPALGQLSSELILKVRRSEEDPRQIWKSISDSPLRLSLAYVATLTPK